MVSLWCTTITLTYVVGFDVWLGLLVNKWNPREPSSQKVHSWHDLYLTIFDLKLEPNINDESFSIWGSEAGFPAAYVTKSRVRNTALCDYVTRVLSDRLRGGGGTDWMLGERIDFQKPNTDPCGRYVGLRAKQSWGLAGNPSWVLLHLNWRVLEGVHLSSERILWWCLRFEIYKYYEVLRLSTTIISTRGISKNAQTGIMWNNVYWPQQWLNKRKKKHLIPSCTFYPLEIANQATQATSFASPCPGRKQFRVADGPAARAVICRLMLGYARRDSHGFYADRSQVPKTCQGHATWQCWTCLVSILDHFSFHVSSGWMVKQFKAYSD